MQLLENLRLFLFWLIFKNATASSAPTLIRPSWNVLSKSVNPWQNNYQKRRVHFCESRCS